MIAARRTARRARNGFALLAVLWVLAGASVVGLTLAMRARSAAGGMGNRVAMRRAEWRAEGCLQLALSEIANETAGGEERAGAAWATVDTIIIGHPPLDASCRLQAEPVGTRLSAASAPPEQLRALFCLSGVRFAAADSLADALADWRDADNDPRPHGAEREWYAQRNLPLPRNAGLANIAELPSVRGFDRWPGLTQMLTVERGRVVPSRASDVVIAAATGVPDSIVRSLKVRLGRPLRTADIAMLASLVGSSQSECQPDGPIANWAMVDVPDAWVLAARASAGVPPVEMTVEYLLARSGRRVALVRRRSWP